ncbi:hypothetical protein [Pseudomonas turukhanskensis]|uniref:Uncharacterized protein n=1 Tax=Pseudomonas turukhanskensis TaxID=1806536 RepID=A0A9W6NEK1_9PSED|nr:hypothetical protein [Pseudomonas turukhanskensis]GLK88063.1 hypothetical protein GCM10017655_11250 [Pseudomonas turukhanskensis]
MELIKLLAESGVLAIILVIAGWLFVFKNSRALARQSEINTLAAAIEKTLQEVADENYKFWKDVSSDEDHLAKSRIFSSYIEYRCNIAEKKIILLFDKSKDCLNPAVEKSEFVLESIKLLAKIRDRSTINSERTDLTHDKYARISAINHLTLKLASEITKFLSVRFQPFSDWKWPENY